MIKRIFLALTIISSLSLYSQKDEEIEFYTDSKVKHSKVYFDAVYSPYFMNRRVLSDYFNPNQITNFLNQSSKGSYGSSFGGNIYLKFNQNFHMGVGANKSSGSYSLDFKRLLEDINGPIDSLSGKTFKMNTDVEYLNIPIQIVFSTRLSDVFELEILPSLELNFIQKLYRELDAPYEYDFDLGDYWGDKTEQANNFNWSAALGIGGNYYITNKFSVFLRGHVRYMIQPIISDQGPNDVLLWLGGQTGVKFYL